MSVIYEVAGIGSGGGGGAATFICAWCKKPIVGMTAWTGNSNDGPRHDECRGRSKILGHTDDGSTLLLSGTSKVSEQDQIEYWREEALKAQKALGQTYRTLDETRREARHAPPPLRTALLARALFETDDEVIAFVTQRAEVCGWDGQGTHASFSAARELRVQSAMSRAWERGKSGASPEHAWYARATERAVLVSVKLRDP